jgi:hypothetical protein
VTRTRNAQRNVTLQNPASLAEGLQGKPFPCPLCGVALPLELTRTEKPYCTCNGCGIQIFFRGKTAIRRLQNLLSTQQAIAEDFHGTSAALALYNRLAHLKEKRDELEQQQGIIFRDRDVDTTIAAINREIQQTQTQLEKAGRGK